MKAWVLRRRADDAGERAEDLGAVAELPRDDGRLVGGARQRGAAQGLAHLVEQQVARGGEIAAEDQALRVEHVEQAGCGDADDAAGVGDHAPAAQVAVQGERDHLGDADVAVAAAQELEQGGRRRGGLQASAVAAPADLALTGHEHVAELARHAAPAAVQAAVEDQSGADARRDLDVDHVGGAATGAVDELAQRAEVGVVVDADGHVEPPAQLLLGGDADPAGQDRGGADDAVDLVDRPGQAEAGADDPRAVDARLGEQLLDDAERHAGGGLEREQDRRPAALLAVGGAGLGALRQQAVGLEVGDEARDRRAREARTARDLRTADRAGAVTPASLQTAPPSSPVGKLTEPEGFVKTLNERLTQTQRNVRSANYPPAIAGRMFSVSPSPTAVSRPCSTRTSSSLRYTFT